MEPVIRRLNAAQILGYVGKLKRETISCPEWGGDVDILELTAGRAAEIGKQSTDPASDSEAIIRWVLASVVDESNAPVFVDNKETREQFKQLGAGPVMRIGNAALRLNGFTDTAVAGAEKNSEASRS